MTRLDPKPEPFAPRSKNEGSRVSNPTAFIVPREQYRTALQMYHRGRNWGEYRRNRKARARARGIEFLLTKQEIKNLIFNAPEACPACGKCMSYCGSTLDVPSIDRKDPTWGYIAGNVEVICVECNNYKNRTEEGSGRNGRMRLSVLAGPASLALFANGAKQ